MKIKKYLNNGGTIFNNSAAVSYVSGFYGSAPEWLNTQLLNMVSMVIEDDFSTRELMQDNTTVDSDLIADINGRNARLLVRNKQKYDHLYKLFNLDYNPIWNVDGTETTQRELTNNSETSGTTTSTLTHNTKTDNTSRDTMTYDTTDRMTYNSGISSSDSDTIDRTDTRTDNLSENTQDNKSRTTFDTANYYDTDKTVVSRTNTGTTGNVESVSELKTGSESKTGNDTGTKTGTETRAITGEVTNTGTDSTSTTNSGAIDGSTNENITLTRQGNIGVTTTQKMALEEINYSDYVKFIDIVALDVVRNFSLGV